MAEWFVGPVMEKLIDACSDYFKDQFRRQTGMKEELLRLRDIRPKIQAVVSAYSQAQIEDPALNKWYWQLRDAIDEADDVLDEFEYMKHEKQVSKDKKKIRKVRSLMKERFVEIGKRALKIDPNLKKLEVAVQKLDRISAEVSAFLHLLDSTKQEQQQQQLELHNTRETGSMPKNDIIGRSKEMEFVGQWLRNPHQIDIINTDFYKNISLLSVVGHGGMGKTTLLQHVYEDGVTEEFDIKIWVCVSDNFDAKTVIKNILESLKKETPHLESLEPLQRSLQSVVSSKRFLLVLDDIWEEDETKWENVLAPLSYGSLGSKILITTRMDSVASMFAKMIKKSKETLQLKGLEEDKCFQLFNTHAFAGVENPDDKLRSIAGKMIIKLLRCPLAIKVIGGILNFNLDESYWTKVLNTNIGNVEPGQNALLPILKLSYIYLPKFLQNCFAFCCIFPQDHEFDKVDLVRMWVALGFIQSPNIQGETLEDIGGRYFDILARKSFFDEFRIGDDKIYYKMHDLLHELAQFVSSQECLRVVDDKELSIPKTIRHLSINMHSATDFKMIGEFKNLRSLFLSYNGFDNGNFMDELSKIFKASKSIRLLFISFLNLPIPETTDCLIHLRYLKLGRWNEQLPRSISHLYHLQFITHVKYSYLFDFIPRDINNLYNLRYLRLQPLLYSTILEIGKLKFLQELNGFIVKNEIGYGIGELEHMNELRQINIYLLENVKDAEEACSAKLYNKKKLTNLSLQWSDYSDHRRNIVDHDLDEKVLDSIQPYNNLKRLCITAYMGVRSPLWMNDVYFTSSNLEYIILDECLKWHTLPPFGQLPFLKSLYLRNMSEVEQLDHNKDCVFPSLEVLHIENLEALQEWFDTTIATRNGCLLPCLTKLYLKNCPKLQELPFLPTKLKELEMNKIGWNFCNWSQGIINCYKIEIQNLPNLIHFKGWRTLKSNENFQLIVDKLVINDPFMLLMEPLRSNSLLRFLTFEGNDELVSFPIETEQWFLQRSSSLFELKFDKLQSLQSLPSSLESLSSLKYLLVSNVPQLKLLPNPLPSLTRLELYNLESQQCMPSSLSTISFLSNLTLKNIPLLKSLPELPSFLMILKLNNLESLQCLPSSLTTISFLRELKLNNIPLLKSLPELPSSLHELELEELQSLQYLQSSLSTISSLWNLKLNNIPLLKSLPDLPSSLEILHLEDLENLDCLPSCPPTLIALTIIKVPRLLELPDLPAYIRTLDIEDCHPQLMEHYKNFRTLR